MSDGTGLSADLAEPSLAPLHLVDVPIPGAEFSVKSHKTRPAIGCQLALQGTLRIWPVISVF